MVNIIYKEGTNINAEELSQLFISSGIKRPSNDLNRLQRMIENSDIIFTAWYQEKLVGIARAITDFSYCCYLSDLAVSLEYQKSGIGSELVRLLQEHIGEEVSLLLLASPTAMDYYPRIGFEAIDNGFKISRKR
ncbi:GNAT family N-acetyltransferase [Lederbergia wuyishanensis]|uniref:N-acetylglutamate synthase-like GNAT family acetyltransferase n=1 Tax=Lederbergia wuyishanensis TaxID=1347903 RepID=A0ABU0D9T7_9BACI|nr:GNAT family N-acetyltransferase [Lederbergia wuyishanensis]MCJ8008446.1 GNAT family N-acetyltransferase [Lederbergia wuyishanensis]MDQ0345189.1 N-acetylglutamate synthase-like GNAT family acetyltransferase [Lederbergia wuyishanensis]